VNPSWGSHDVLVLENRMIWGCSVSVKYDLDEVANPVTFTLRLRGSSDINARSLFSLLEGLIVPVNCLNTELLGVF
jgi:hypothetical protein